MKRDMKRILLAFILIMVIATGCDKNNDLVLFSINNDIELGEQVAAEIASDPATYPVLDRASNSEAYAYLDAMRDQILNSGNVSYKDEFEWELHIIDDDETLNAFATPGGFIYIYTGLIKYLESADHLAGVLGHEIAHSDQRHTSKNIQTQYSVGILLSILLGEDAGEIAQIAADLASGAAYLKFSRSYEEEADEYSVLYLSETNYACNGAAGFFEKLLDSGQTSGVPEFLSTHPAEASRVTDINAQADEQGCDTSPISESGMTYEEFKALF